jgi:hypothetical protein
MSWRSILTRGAALAALLVLAGCSDNITAPEFSTCVTSGPLVEIADNHPTGSHEMIVSGGDVFAAEEKVYDIRGDNVGHTHTVTVTEPDFLSLQDGDPVTVVSSNNGSVGNSHTHAVTLSCP